MNKLYVLEGKEFNTEEECEKYIGDNLSDWFDFYLNDDVDRLIAQKMEEMEVIEADEQLQRLEVQAQTEQEARS